MKIKAIIANTGNGNVSVGNINMGDVNLENTKLNDRQEDFLALLEDIRKEVSSLNDNAAQEALKTIQEETEKGTWCKNIVKFSLDTLQKTGVTLAAQGLTALVSKAAALLPFI